ncbi:MAG: DMT family transporter [Pseudorhodoplanes sp.]
MRLAIDPGLFAPESSLPALSPLQRGIIAMVLSMGLFVASDVFSKKVALLYSPSQVMVFRSTMIVAMCAVVLLSNEQARSFLGIFNRANLLRAFFDGTASVLYIVALMHLPLAVATSVVLLVPLLITAMSVVMFGERIGWNRWAAVIVGFIGAVVIVRPSPSAIDIWALIALCCAFCMCGRDLATRQIDPAMPSFLVTLTGAAAGVLGGLVLATTEHWHSFTWLHLGWLFAGSIVHCLGMFTLIVAARVISPSITAPYRYVALLWAGVAGYIFFGEIPDHLSLLGIVLIAGSGLYALHRARVRNSEMPADPR